MSTTHDGTSDIIQVSGKLSCQTIFSQLSDNSLSEQEKNDLLEQAIKNGGSEAPIARANQLINKQDSSLHAEALDLLTLSLPQIEEHRDWIIKLWFDLAAQNCLPAEYFLFINLYEPSPYCSLDEPKALTLFKKHPGAHLMSFTDECIRAMQLAAFKKEHFTAMHASFSTLLDNIPEQQETPMTGAACNKYLAYIALLMERDIDKAYEHFTLIPPDLLFVNDLYQLANMIWAGADKDQVKAKNLALSLVRMAMEKDPQDERLREMSNLLQQLILNPKGLPNTATLPPEQIIGVRAVRTPVNNAHQQIAKLQDFSTYLQWKETFEPAPAKPIANMLNNLGMWHKSPDLPTTVNNMIKQLNDGESFENVVTQKHIVTACKQFPALNNIITELRALPLLPANSFSFK